MMRVQSQPTDSCDVFISYAWKDDELPDGKQGGFVTKLYRELTEKGGKSVWLDKKKIRAGEHISEEFLLGVQKSDNFIPILSSRYLAREDCLAELNSAIARKKRIIPVLRVEDFDFKQLPEEARRRLAIRFTDEADFDSAFQELLEAIDTDLEYVRAHTRLLVRAEEWEDRNRDSSYLLRGSDLKNAEQLRDMSASRDQMLNPLQIDFINHSRKAEQDRQRRNRIITIVVAVVTTVLAIFASVQAVRATQAAEAERLAKEDAIDQRNEAQRIAQTFAIVDNTLKQPLGSKSGRPLLVGTELWVSSRAENTLWRLRADTGERIGDPIPLGSPPRDPVYDGRWLWVSTAETLVRLDPTDATQRMNVFVGRYPQPPVIVGEWLWVLSADDGTMTQVARQSGGVSNAVNVERGARSAVPGGDYIWVINPETQKLIRIHPATGEGLIIEVGADAQPPVFVGGSVWLLERTAGILRQVEPDTGETLREFEVGNGLKPPVVSGGFLWLISPATKEVIQINPVDGAEIRRFTIGLQTSDVFVEGETVWIFTDEDRLFRYELENGELLTSIRLSSGALNPVLDGLHLWLTDSGGSQLVLIRLDTGQVARQLPHCLNPLPPVFDGVNMWVTCQSENAIARIPALMGYYGLGEMQRNTEPSSPIYDGRYIWITQAADEKIVQFDADTGVVLADIPVGKTPLPPVFDGRYIWVAAEKSAQVTRIDTQDVRNVLVIPTGGQPNAIMRDDDFIWVSAMGLDTDKPNDLIRIDRATGKVLNTYNMGIATFAPVADDGVIWVSATSMTGAVYRLDANTGEQLSYTKVGSPPRPPVLDGSHVWVVSLYAETMPEDVIGGTENFLLGGGTFDMPGALYRLNRRDGSITGQMQLEAFPSQPLLAGGKLWITQTALVPQFIGQNERGVMVINPLAFDDPNAEKVAAGWSPCTDVTEPVYAGRFVWIGCLNLNDDKSVLLVINPDTLEVAHEYHDLGLAAWPAKQIENTVWVVYQRTGSAAVFDATTGDLLRVLGLGKHPTQPAYDGQRMVWISNSDSGTVQRIDLTTIKPPG
jgi:outer membrane protein assembly factor BamB